MKKAIPITVTILLLVTLVLMMMQTVTVYQVEPVSHGITTMKFYASITLLLVNVALVGGLIVNIIYFYKAYRLSRIKDKSKVIIDDLFDTLFKDTKEKAESRNSKATKEETSAIAKKYYENVMNNDLFKRKEEVSEGVKTVNRLKHEDVFGKPIGSRGERDFS